MKITHKSVIVTLNIFGEFPSILLSPPPIYGYDNIGILF